jgi:hypothetical protein
MADPRDETEGTRSTWPALIRRLRQRKLIQWTLAYAAAAFAMTPGPRQLSGRSRDRQR